MKTPIERLFDASVRCTKCDATLAVGCKCWVKLKCTECSAVMSVERFEEAFDYDEIETTCPDCEPS